MEALLSILEDIARGGWQDLCGNPIPGEQARRAIEVLNGRMTPFYAAMHPYDKAGVCSCPAPNPYTDTIGAFCALCCEDINQEENYED